MIAGEFHDDRRRTEQLFPNPSPRPPPRSGEGEKGLLLPLSASGRGEGGRGSRTDSDATADAAIVRHGAGECGAGLASGAAPERGPGRREGKSVRPPPQAAAESGAGPVRYSADAERRPQPDGPVRPQTRSQEVQWPAALHQGRDVSDRQRTKQTAGHPVSVPPLREGRDLDVRGDPAP